MKIDLTTTQSRQEIASVRSYITDAVSLRKFDEFVARNDRFDFNNDEHLQALRKGDCPCVVIPLTIYLD